MTPTTTDSPVGTTTEWRDSLSAFLHPRVITMLFLGFSAGVPILLIFSSLSLWLREAGVERAAVTFFSWAALGYSFKFVWAPLVDRLPLPILTQRLGRRRAWMLVAQTSIIIAIVWMALTDPGRGEQSLIWMAWAAVLLGFSSATQDIVIDAYRIESAEVRLQAMMSSTYIAGYRIGMLVAGAGALFLAGWFGSTPEAYNYRAWQWSYLLMALAMLVGVLTTMLIPEPSTYREKLVPRSTRDYLGFLVLFGIAVTGFILTFFHATAWSDPVSRALKDIFDTEHLASVVGEAVRLGSSTVVAGILAVLISRTGIVNQEMLQETYVAPVKDFFRRYGMSSALLLLGLVGVYRISDIVIGVIANVFYQDMGFTKVEIASVVKTFGLFMTIAGGFLGGLLSVRHGVIKILFLGAFLSAITNLLFLLLASVGHDLFMLYLVLSIDNLSAGLASAAFVAFLSSLTNVQFTAMQYAIFSSMMTLFPKLFGGYSGTIVDSLGYPAFFIMTTLMGLPVLALVTLAKKTLRTP